MKKYLVALDSYKGCLSSVEASVAFATGIREGDPAALVTVVPVADGGEGTAAVLARGLEMTERVVSRVPGPLGDEVDAEWWWRETDRTACIDLAQASGLTLVEERHRNPLLATSYGFGLLILRALERGAVRIIAGLGGSATVDGGMGACQALGVRFLDAAGVPIATRASGGMLSEVADIDVSCLDARLAKAELILVCDVSSPLTGMRGAARVFAPQKGASPQDVERLEAGLENLRDVVLWKRGVDLDALPGSGAAGGCGGTLAVLAGGAIVDGASFVVDTLGLRGLVEDVDVVVTGEGSADAQTLLGKLPSGILRVGMEAGVPVALAAGVVKDALDLEKAGFSPVICINAPDLVIASRTQGLPPMRPDVAAARLWSAGLALSRNLLSH